MVSKITRRFKLDIHTITYAVPPSPALRIRPLAWDRINRRPLAFVIIIIFIIFSLDLFILLYYNTTVQQ